MIDFQRMFHTGLLVPDLAWGMEHYGRTLGLKWAKPFTFEELPLWTPADGLHHLRLEVTYSTQGPQHLEIQVGPEGTYYDPRRRSGYHVGVWVDDVAAEVAGLQAQGWQVEAAGATPEEGWGTFVYLQPPGGGLTVELCSVVLQPMFDKWWGGADSLA